MTLSELFTYKTPFLDVSLFAVVLALIANILFGAIWYSPQFFGETWAEGHKFDPSEMKPTILHFLGAILVSAVLILTLATLFDFIKITRLTFALEFTAIIWLGFIATSHFSGVIWAKKTLTVYFIDVIYYLLCMLIAASILITIPRYLPESWVAHRYTDAQGHSHGHGHGHHHQRPRYYEE